MSPVISLWSKYKSKAFIESNGMRNEETLGPLNWKQKKPFYCNFITHPYSVCFTYPIIQVRWFSMFVRCIHFGVLSLGWRHTNCEITHIIFWHFRCLLSRKDNKDKWQQNTKSPRQTAFIHDKSLKGMRREKKIWKCTEVDGDILSLSIA